MIKLFDKQAEYIYHSRVAIDSTWKSTRIGLSIHEKLGWDYFGSMNTYQSALASVIMKFFR